MNTLIIGNGFDLAHGLKTSYSDFLNQISAFSSTNYMPVYMYPSNIDQFFYGRTDMIEAVYDSILFQYMWSRFNENKGWIDFENELREIVEGVCDLPKYLTTEHSFPIQEQFQTVHKLARGWEQNISPFMYSYFESHRLSTYSNIDIQEIIDDVSQQIRAFIKLFREYIRWVNQHDVPTLKPLKLFSKLRVGRLLSFNYTLTGPLVYKSAWQLKPENICYVHGKIGGASDDHIVMGIGSDFYDADKYTDFLPFYKFYQCYKYKTDMSYLDWLSQGIMPGEPCNIYIYGHSLDPTDENILLPFLDYNPEDTPVQIIIYYFDESSLLSLEKNLVKILGREKFDLYLRGTNPKIQFRSIPSSPDSAKASTHI